jgi:hypothetical protein
MRNAMLLITMLVTFPNELLSQKLNFVVEQGLGSYKMNDLKQFNNLILNSLPFEAAATENFPAYWNYSASFVLSLNKMAFGVTCSYQSTGSRISRADYSGEYAFDTKINSVSPGFFAEFHIPLNEFLLSINNEVGIELSKLSLIEYLVIGSVSQEDAYKFKSQNIYCEPSVRLSYPVLFFRLGVGAGYLVDFKKGTFKSTDSDEIKLSDGNPVTADWSGVRLSATLSFQLFKFGAQVESH